MNDAKYVGLMCIRQRSPRRFGILTASWSWRLSWKRKRKPCCSLFTVCVAACMSPSKKAPAPDWLYTLLKPHVTEVLVCDPRKNALLKVGNKGDRIDARSDRIWEHWHARAKIQRCEYIYSATSVHIVDLE